MAKARHKSVKFSPEEMAYDLPEEVDFSKLTFIGRGRRAQEAVDSGRLVPLDPDVAKVFGTHKAVNEALRNLIELAKNSTRKSKKTA